MGTSLEQWPALVVTDGRQAGRSITIGAEHVVLGCSPEVDLVLDGRGVARRHAEVYRSPNGIVLRDLGSEAGTRVNGELIADLTNLQPGDKVSLGEVTLRLGLVMAVNTLTPMDLLVPAQRTPEYDALGEDPEPSRRKAVRVLIVCGLLLALAAIGILIVR